MTQLFPKSSQLLRAVVLAGSLSLWSDALPAQVPSYFPLKTGDIWLFRSVTVNPETRALETDYQNMRVRSNEKIGDTDYFNVSYFGRELTLRSNPATGEVVQYDRAAGIELPWLSLALPVGGSFPTSLNGCPSQGQIASRTGMVAIPDGDPTDVLQVDFNPLCAGATRHFYAPNVGLIRSEESTPSGPRVYRLMYYRVGTTIGAGPEVSFSMGLDSPPHFTGGILVVRLSLRNASFEGLTLHFPSSQSYDLQILNDKGDIVYTWSSDKTFAAIAREEKLENAGELAFGVSVPLDNFAPGRYTARGFLTTDPLQYRAEVAFDVAAVGR